MAVVVENQYTDTGKKVDTITITDVVVPSGSNRAMYMLIGCSAKNTDGGKFVTSCVWDAAGVDESFTSLGVAQEGKAWASIFRLKAPTAKTATVTISFLDTDANFGGYTASIEVLSGVDQTTPEDTWETPSQGTSSPSAHAVATASGDLVYAVAGYNPRSTVTENGDGTEIWNETGGINHRAASSSFVADDSSANMSWSFGTSPEWVVAGVSINPAAAGSALVEVVDENQNITEQINAHVERIAVEDENQNITEQINAHLAQVVIEDEDQNITEQLNAHLSQVRIEDEDENITEQFNHVKVLPASIEDEDENITEGLVTVLGIVAVEDEDQNITEQINAHVERIAVVDEDENITEQLNAHLSQVRIEDEDENITEQFNAHLAQVRIEDEDENITEAINHVKVLPASVEDEDENITEGIVTKVTVGGSALVEVTDEDENITEGLVSIVERISVVDEDENVTEQINAHLAHVEITDEDENITESVESHLSIVFVVDENLNITEGTVTARTLVIVVDENQNVTEQENRTVTLPAFVVDENQNITEGIVSKLSVAIPPQPDIILFDVFIDQLRTETVYIEQLKTDDVFIDQLREFTVEK